MLSFTNADWFHLLTLGVFATSVIALRRQLKAGMSLSDLKILVFVTVVFGALTIYTLFTVLLTITRHFL